MKGSSPGHSAGRAGPTCIRIANNKLATLNDDTMRRLVGPVSPGTISFAGGLPDPETFHLKEFRAAFDLLLQDQGTGSASLQYSATQGLFELRSWLAERARLQGVPATAENFIITTGAQQALDLIGRLFLSVDEVVMVEAPTYLGTLQAFGVHQPRYVELPSRPLNRTNLAALPRLPRALVYIVSDFANPTGMTLSADERHALVDFAAVHEAVLVEDIAYRELRFHGDDQPSILACDVQRHGSVEMGRTLQCGTFSKTLAPGLRVGWICGPSKVIEHLVRLKQSADVNTSTISQRVALAVIEKDYDGLCQRVRAAYRVKAVAMLGALRDAMPDAVAWTCPDGGMFIWLELPAFIDSEALFTRAEKRGVLFVPGRPFFAVAARQHYLRLSYSLPSLTEIREGVRRLAKLIQDELDRAGVSATVHSSRRRPACLSIS